jgi:hypothetical protein
MKPLLLILLACLTMTFASCRSGSTGSNDDAKPADSNAEKIIGRWTVVKVDGKDLPKLEKITIEFIKEGKGIISGGGSTMTTAAGRPPSKDGKETVKIVTEKEGEIVTEKESKEVKNNDTEEFHYKIEGDKITMTRKRYDGEDDDEVVQIKRISADTLVLTDEKEGEIELKRN